MGANPVVLRFSEVEAEGQDRLACRATSVRGDCPSVSLKLELVDCAAGSGVASEERVVEATFDVRLVLDFAPRFGPQRVVTPAGPSRYEARHPGAGSGSARRA